jgi:antitoxin component YwqK of YwqJK toxin-antitoxin module
MKKLLTLTLLFFCLTNAFSQKIDTLYYDSNWKGVPVKALAAYMRIIYKAPKGTLYSDIQKDYFITGELQAEGDFPIYIDRYDDSKSKWKGKYIRYYKNGKKEAEGFNNDSSQYEGKQYLFYESGQLKWSGDFNNGLPNGELQQFYENGKPSESSIYTNGKLQSSNKFFENGKQSEANIYVDGAISSGIKYYENGNVQFKATFKNEKVNGTFFQYLEDGSGHYETEMLAGEKVSNMTTFEDNNGNRIKYNLESKEVIQDKPTLADMKSTVSNGATFLYYKMNGIFLAVNTTISSDNGKYFLASIVIGNNLNQSIQFEADKLSGYVEKDVKTYTCKVYTSDEFATIVGKKLRSKSFWNSVGQNLATMNAGVSTSSTSTLSAGYVNSAALAADNNGNVVAGVGSAYGANSTVSQTQTYNAGAQYQANQNAQRNISQYNNQLEQYQSALDEGYLKSNVIESGKSITGNMNIKYQKGDKFILYIPLNGSVYPFEWTM